MSYRGDLRDVAAENDAVITVAQAEDAGVPAIEVRKLASRGALSAYGQGVYLHSEVARTPRTQLRAAVALAGEGAFLVGETVLSLFELGQLNPRWVTVATPRRVRRTLPEWMRLEVRHDITEDDLTDVDGLAMTTVAKALQDVHPRVAPDRFKLMVDEALERQLIGAPLASSLTRRTALSGAHA